MAGEWPGALPIQRVLQHIATSPYLVTLEGGHRGGVQAVTAVCSWECG